MGVAKAQAGGSATGTVASRTPALLARFVPRSLQPSRRNPASCGIPSAERGSPSHTGGESHVGSKIAGENLRGLKIGSCYLENFSYSGHRLLDFKMPDSFRDQTAVGYFFALSENSEFLSLSASSVKIV